MFKFLHCPGVFIFLFFSLLLLTMLGAFLTFNHWYILYLVRLLELSTIWHTTKVEAIKQILLQ